MDIIPGGMHIVMDSVGNINIIYYFVYKYNLSKFQSFISTPGIVPYFPAYMYRARWCGHCGNFHVIFSPVLIV